MDIQQLKKQRFLFLQKVYKESEGDTHCMVEIEKIGQELGMDNLTSGRTAQYLIDEGLLEAMTEEGGIVISHEGVLEVEEALLNPDKSTQHFLPLNIIHVHSMNNSVIQQGTTNSTQNVTITSDNISELKSFLSDLKTAIEKMQLSVEIQSEVIAEIATLDAQANSPKPKRSIIGEALNSLRSVLEGVAGNLATPLFQVTLPHLISTFSN
ncbi:MAG TPA: hypothetical protein VF487_06100 [Chitinophagaceae bacterium]